MKQLVLSLGLALFFNFQTVPVVMAVGIIPQAPKKCVLITEKEVGGKKQLVKLTPGEEAEIPVLVALRDSKKFTEFVNGDTVPAISRSEKLSQALGCAIKTGRMHLFMAPYFITYIVQFLLEIAGIISVLFIVLGGFRYAVGGLTEDKESGKKYIQNALIGLVVSFSAWMVVNFIQIALTS